MATQKAADKGNRLLDNLDDAIRACLDHGLSVDSVEYQFELVMEDWQVHE